MFLYKGLLSECTTLGCCVFIALNIDGKMSCALYFSCKTVTDITI